MHDPGTRGSPMIGDATLAAYYLASQTDPYARCLRITSVARPIRFAVWATGLLGLLAACSPSAGTSAIKNVSATTSTSTSTTATGTANTTMPNTDSTNSETAVRPRTIRLRYGDAPEQFGDLTLIGDALSPVVVLVHGGFWRNPYDLTLMEPLAADLAARGYAVWNVEYRRLGDPGGGWPGTLDDVAAAVDELEAIAAEHPIDLRRVGVVGHSAGGHLALWTGGRGTLDPTAPGTDPRVTPLVAIGQGAVVDLAGAANARLGNGAVEELLGGSPEAEPDRFRWATPSLSAGPRMVSVVGSADTIVPPAFSADPERPDAIDLVEVDGADHFDLIDPGHAAWRAVVDRLDAVLQPDAG